MDGLLDRSNPTPARRESPGIAGNFWNSGILGVWGRDRNIATQIALSRPILMTAANTKCGWRTEPVCIVSYANVPDCCLFVPAGECEEVMAVSGVTRQPPSIVYATPLDPHTPSMGVFGKIGEISSVKPI